MFDIKLQQILHAFAELDITPDATLEESKRQYRDLVQVWHPDRHSANERLQKKAEDKLKRINAAWELVHEFFRIQEAIKKQEEELERRYREGREQKKRELEKEKREQEEREQEEVKRQREKRERLEREERQRIEREEEERQKIDRLTRERRVREEEQHKEKEEPEQRRAEELRYVLHDCPACSVTNRIQRESSLKDAKCGKCGVPLGRDLGRVVQELQEEKSYWTKSKELPIKLWVITSHGIYYSLLVLFLVLAAYRSISEYPLEAERLVVKQPTESDNSLNSQAGSENKLVTDKSNMSAAMQAYESGNYSKALAVFKVYAEKNDTLAQWYLGQMCFAGKGVPQNYREAGKWYRIAAEHGDVYAQHDLATMYLNGYGVAPDYREAEKWYQRAAEQGNADAQYHLGVMYLKGKGVVKDYGEAKKWFRKAAKHGHVKATKALE